MASDAESQRFMGDLAEQAAALPVAEVIWDQPGPQLLQRVMKNTPSHNLTIQSPSFAKPVDWWKLPGAPQNDEALTALQESTFLHLYAERWRRAGCDISKELEGGLRVESWMSKERGDPIVNIDAAYVRDQG